MSADLFSLYTFYSLTYPGCIQCDHLTAHEQ